MNKTFKRYAISTALSFLTGFCIAILPALDNLSLENLSYSIIGGILFAAVRSGLKAAIEGGLNIFKSINETPMACGGKKTGKKK